MWNRFDWTKVDVAVAACISGTDWPTFPIIQSVVALISNGTVLLPGDAIM
jgi:hypothetical protein